MKAKRNLIPIWLLCAALLPAVAQAQFTFTTNTGAITIVNYTGSGSHAVTIPDTTNGYPVTSIGDDAFQGSSVTGVAIGANVTTIGAYAFDDCENLTSMTIPNTVTKLGDDAFYDCIRLAGVTIGTGVTSIGEDVFGNCTKLASVTIPNTVTNLGDFAFEACTSLTTAYFFGNAPGVNGGSGNADSTAFYGESGTVYFIPGTTGWGATFGGWPTALWYQPNPMILGSGYGLGATTNGFGFTISWATNIPVVVDACTNFVNPAWQPVATNTLTGGTSYFSDSSWTNYPGRFYRVRSP